MNTCILKDHAAQIGLPNLLVILSDEEATITKMLLLDEMSIEHVAEKMDMTVDRVLEICENIDKSVKPIVGGFEESAKL